MNKSDYLRNDNLVRKYTTAPAYIEVSSTRIDPDGTGGTYPASLTRTEITENITANLVQNSADVNLGNVSAGDDALVMKWWRTMDAAAAGNQLHQGLIGTNKFFFVASAEDDKIKINGGGPPFVADDRVMFDGEALPTGITAGTSYFVLTPDANDNFQISLTSGGAAINFTTDGEGFGVQGTGVTLVQNQDFVIPVNNFDLHEY